MQERNYSALGQGRHFPMAWNWSTYVMLRTTKVTWFSRLSLFSKSNLWAPSVWAWHPCFWATTTAWRLPRLPHPPLGNCDPEAGGELATITQQVASQGLEPKTLIQWHRNACSQLCLICRWACSGCLPFKGQPPFPCFQAYYVTRLASAHISTCHPEFLTSVFQHLWCLLQCWTELTSKQPSLKSILVKLCFPKSIWKFQWAESVTVTLFGKSVFVDVLKLKWGQDGL